MIDNGGVCSAFGLGALAGIVDDEGIKERQVGQKGVGVTIPAKPDSFSRQPLKRAVLAHMNHGVSSPAAVRFRRDQPFIQGIVVVRWG